MSGEPTDVQDNSVDPGAALGLHDRGYLMLLLVVALLGIPLSMAAFGFLATVHWLEHLVWEIWPHNLGYAELPAWWPILTVGVAGFARGAGSQVPARARRSCSRRGARCWRHGAEHAAGGRAAAAAAWWVARCSDRRRP